jgi:hypothetical protein
MSDGQYDDGMTDIWIQYLAKSRPGNGSAFSQTVNAQLLSPTSLFKGRGIVRNLRKSFLTASQAAAGLQPSTQNPT